ncbi:MAG: ATP-binding protein [Elusimicrobia bacterium]|nr:ATP-binding protein [Elusimicrobiota bacterium]
MKLSSKFLVFILALTGVSLWASLYFSRQAVSNVISVQVANDAALEAAEILPAFRKTLATGREADGLTVLRAFQQRTPLIYAGLLRPDLKLQAHTNVLLAGAAADLGWVRSLPAREPVYRRTLYRGEEIVETLIPVRAAEDASGGKILLDGAAENGAPEGYIWAGFSLAPARKAEKGIVSKLLLTTALLLLAVLIISGFFVRLMLRPVGLLQEGMRKAREGDLAWEVKVSSRDEIGRLTRFFNELLKDLKNKKNVIEVYQQTLEQKVEKRSRQLEDSQERLVQASKMAVVGQLVSGVAHELNNPLAGIMGYAQIMLKDSALSAQQREDLEVILLQARRCKEFIQHLLLFSRKRESVRETVSVHDLLAGVMKLLSLDFFPPGMEVVQDVPSELPPVFGDAAQLQQVFFNIIANARDAMVSAKGGRLQIKAAAAGNMIVLKFTNTGPVIPEGNLDRIFEPFFTTKPKGKGTGIGLSISREIVENHKGRLSAESGPGGETTFTVELPVKNENQ